MVTDGQKLFQKMLRKTRGTPGYKCWRWMFDLTEEICRVMSEQKLTIASLAKKAKVSKASFLTLLEDCENAKVGTLVRVQWALHLLPGLKPLVKKQEAKNVLEQCLEQEERCRKKRRRR